MASKITNHPSIVDKILLSVSNKLGREATIRKVKNFDQYFIIDLAFSYFQKADRNRRNDYRSGFLFFKDEKSRNCLLFAVAHTPIMFSFLLNNFDYSFFRQIVINTSKYRDEHFLIFKNKGEKQLLKNDDLDTFLKEIDHLEKTGFAKIAFSKYNSSEKGIGNIFSFGIAKDFEEKDIDKIINLSWELFLWLYPSKVSTPRMPL